MYDWTIWLDHVLNPANRYTVVQNGDGTWTITPTGTVMQQGTPQDQIRFNNVEKGIVDAHAALAVLLNFARQQGWKQDDILQELIGEVGTVTLNNSETFPFNNSMVTVSLAKPRTTQNYIVIVDVPAAVGNVGEIVITDSSSTALKSASPARQVQ